MKDNMNYTLDMIGAYGFGMMAALALYGVIALGAWWHIGTMLMCVAVAKAELADARKEKADDSGWSKQDDHNPYPEE